MVKIKLKLKFILLNYKKKKKKKRRANRCDVFIIVEWNERYHTNSANCYSFITIIIVIIIMLWPHEAVKYFYSNILETFDLHFRSVTMFEFAQNWQNFWKWCVCYVFFSKKKQLNKHFDSYRVYFCISFVESRWHCSIYRLRNLQWNFCCPLHIHSYVLILSMPKCLRYNQVLLRIFEPNASIMTIQNPDRVNGARMWMLQI